MPANTSKVLANLVGKSELLLGRRNQFCCDATFCSNEDISDPTCVMWLQQEALSAASLSATSPIPRHGMWGSASRPLAFEPCEGTRKMAGLTAAGVWVDRRAPCLIMDPCSLSKIGIDLTLACGKSITNKEAHFLQERSSKQNR
jgi:hypothetical protein